MAHRGGQSADTGSFPGRLKQGCNEVHGLLFSAAKPAAEVEALLFKVAGAPRRRHEPTS